MMQVKLDTITIQAEDTTFGRTRKTTRVTIGEGFIQIKMEDMIAATYSLEEFSKGSNLILTIEEKQND